MKKTLIVIILICISIITKSQTTTYYLCPALQAFNGEWRYVNGQDTIRIYLRYHEFTSNNPTPNTRGSLFGWHEYKRGNTVIESDYTNRFMTLATDFYNIGLNSYSILLSSNAACDTSTHRLRGQIKDLLQTRESKPVTIQFNAAKTEIQWHQRQGYGIFSPASPMTLPPDFVLIKQ